jgi:NADP-dependent 3-hydroxy acid dehydrogenase YdfG
MSAESKEAVTPDLAARPEQSRSAAGSSQESSSMTPGIEGKVVVITGASSGLGEATARLLASRGAHVAIAARRRERLDRIVAELTKPGTKAKSYQIDVIQKAQVDGLIDNVLEDFGRIDVLVNNAGIMPIAPLSQRRTDEWDRMIDVNIRGLLYGIAAVLPVFEKQGSGHVINLGSVAGIKVFSPGGTVYSATKFAVRAISEGLRHEVGGKMRVTVIEPGAVDSELKYNSGDEASRRNIIEFYKQAISASSVARAIAYAIEQPGDVDINEIVLRPTVQEF